MNRNIKVFLLIISIFLLTSCTSDTSSEEFIKDMSLEETMEIFKKDVGFHFYNKEKEDNFIASGFSPEDGGNAKIKLIGDDEADKIEKIHFTYYMPEDMSDITGDHLYNSIYLNLLLDTIPNFEESKDWIISQIQGIDDVEKVVDEKNTIDGNSIEVQVGGEEFRKLDLIIYREKETN